MNKALVIGSLCVVALLHLGCGDQGIGDDPEETGALQAALQIPVPATLGPTHDVTAIRYTVVKDGESCNSPTPVAVVRVDLEKKPLPTSELPPGGGTKHPFADALIPLAPGTYTVCAQPVNEFGGPSSQCAPDIRSVRIVATATTELLFVSQCPSIDNGAMDAITILNNDPVITNLTIKPSKFITRCDTVELSVEATDPDGDKLTFLWELRNTTLRGTKQTFSFVPPSVGTFLVTVTVRDGELSADALQGQARLTVPVHVAECSDGGTD